MGSIDPFPSGVLVIGILSSVAQPLVHVENELVSAFGAIATQSPVIEFSHSSYYVKEMGGPLFKQWIGIWLPEIYSPTGMYKEQTQAIEQRHKWGEKRTVNLDPGLLFPHQLMVFSTKNYAHRIPISDGIYGELELLYRNGNWDSLPWTYPDYQLPEIQNFFTQCRHCII